jgi:hypothetical protein
MAENAAAATAAPSVTIDGVKYAISDLTKDARSQLVNLRFVDQEISRLQNQLAVCRTARARYAEQLQKEIPEKK